MPQVLFLCTGNYYRSRLAEMLFNHWANQKGSPWRADSRGLRITGANPGPLSPHTRKWMADQKIPLPEPLRFPIPAKEADFWQAQTIVAVKEAEHRAMIRDNFPHWEHRVEYWHVHDLDFAEPVKAIPELATLVERLYAKLHESPSGSGG